MSENIVLTGPPCAGKSTLVDLLGRLAGFPTIHEMAREIIMEGKLHPMVDPIAFRREAKTRQLAHEALFVGSNELVFQDRGVFDGIGYCYATGCPVPDFLDAVGGPRYKLAFLLEELPSYEFDGVRYEDKEFAMVLRHSLERAYIEKGVPVIHVPVMPSLLARLRFIMETVCCVLQGPGQVRRRDDFMSRLSRMPMEQMQSV